MEEYTNYLVHHGVKGMKWGVRRYQNADGSLTAAGRKKYGIKSERSTKDKVKKTAKVVGAVGAGAAGVGAAGVAISAVSTARKINNYKKPDSSDETKNNAAFDRTIKRGKDKTNVSPAEDVTNKANQGVNSMRDTYRATKNLINRSKRISDQKKREAEVKRMSNEELNKRIKRLNLEKQYLKLSDPYIDEGHDRVDDVLSVVGGIVGLVSLGANIAATVYMLKHR